MGGHMAMPRDHIVMMHEGLRVCCFFEQHMHFVFKKCCRDHMAMPRPHMAMPSELHGNA